MEIILMPGHAHKADGAVCCAGYYDGFGEYMLARQYLPALGDALTARGHTVKLTNREQAGGTTPSYSAKAANKVGGDIALEFHFNSASSDTTGCEVLYWHKSAKGKEFAEKLSARLAKLLGVRNRGAKPIGGSEDDRGYHAFRVSRMPFFMIEPCFAGSNPEEARIFGQLIREGAWQRHAAEAINLTIEEVYGS